MADGGVPTLDESWRGVIGAVSIYLGIDTVATADDVTAWRMVFCAYSARKITSNMASKGEARYPLGIKLRNSDRIHEQLDLDDARLYFHHVRNRSYTQ